MGQALGVHLERCPSQKRGSKERQGPTLGVCFTEVSVLQGCPLRESRLYTEMILHFRKFLVQRNLDGDWQNMFPITRFHYIGALFHIFYCYWGKENRLLYRGLHLIYRLRFIISRFLCRYLFALSLTNSPNFIPANSHALGVSLTPAS